MLARKTNFTIAHMVRLLEVFGSGYYVWLDHADVYPVDAVKPQNVRFGAWPRRPLRPPARSYPSGDSGD